MENSDTSNELALCMRNTEGKVVKSRIKKAQKKHKFNILYETTKLIFFNTRDPAITSLTFSLQ